MSTADIGLAGRDQAHFGPVFLVTALASGLAAMVGIVMALAGEDSAGPSQVATGLLAAWLLTSASWIAGTQAAAEARWRRRLAPSAAAHRARQGYAALRLELAACAGAGPAVMLVAQAFVRPAHDVLGLAAGAVALLGAALLAGTWLGLRTQPAHEAWLRRWHQSAARWLGGWRRWRRVPTVSEVAMNRNSHGGLVWLVLLPQYLTQGPSWRFLAWGAPLAEGWTLAWFGIWMFVMCMLANVVTLGPSLHWRARLAPGGLAPGAWARRMLAASLLSALGWMAFELAVGAVFTPEPLRAAQFSSWAPVAADALLAMTWVLWVRGVRNTGPFQLLACISLGVAAPLLLAAVQALGFSPQRGALLLALELAAAGLLAVAAQRAWARQDLSRLVPLH